MGFTPLEGLIMGTRSGSIDPSLPLYLAAHGSTPTEVASILNTQSGLLALSGRTSDVRELVAAASQGDERADAALDAFCYSIKKCIGAYAAALGGVDGIVFGGGVGENSAEIRQRVCTDMEWCGIHIDAESNRLAVDDVRRLDGPPGNVEVWAVRVRESAIVAQEVFSCLADGDE